MSVRRRNCVVLVTLPRTPVPPIFARSTEVPGLLLSTGVQDIIEPLGPREVVEQAIALLMARSGVSRDAAFEMLVRTASDSRRTVREVAAAIGGQPGD